MGSIRVRVFALFVIVLIVAALAAARQSPQSSRPPAATPQETEVSSNASRMMDEGRRAFRYDTFGDEAFLGRHPQAPQRDCRCAARRRRSRRQPEDGAERRPEGGHGRGACRGRRGIRAGTVESSTIRQHARAAESQRRRRRHRSIQRQSTAVDRHPVRLCHSTVDDALMPRRSAIGSTAMRTAI